MKSKKHIPLLSCLVLLALVGTVQASVITSTANFNDTKSSSGSGQITFTELTANFAPFNASLGTLQSFIFDWEVTLSTSSITSSAGGGFSQSIGGNTYINTFSYHGGGGGGSNGGGPNTTLPATPSPVSIQDTYLVANANPTILSIVTGGSNFDLAYKPTSGPNLAIVNFTNMAAISSSLTGSVSVSYDYTPAVPEPSTYLLLTISLGVVGYVRKKMTHREEQTAV